MLDLKLAASDADGVGGFTFSQYSSRLKQRSSLQAQLQSQEGFATLAEQLATYLSLTNAEDGEPLQALRRDAAVARKKANDMVYY